MLKNKFPSRLIIILITTAVFLCAIILLNNPTTHANDQVVHEFGYGLSMAALEIDDVEAMGFNWIRVFDPPGMRHPVNVLLRLPINANHLADVDSFGESMAQMAQAQRGYVDAYELGNEVNLDASYGWAAPPNAADYAYLLCEAYGRIKAIDPNVTIVSAGLAPVGRIPNSWNGHLGHNGLYQDDREYMKEFLAAGGGACFDAFGYHPFGYSADFDVEPDQWSADSTRNCSNGFCFRGVEKIYEILQTHGLGHKQIWATEYGWLTLPPDSCTNDGSWNGRFWQIVSEEKQASNLVGSFLYAREHYPWMGAMFIFNYNFNTAAWYGQCEQMRFYSIKDRLAQSAVATLPKVSNPETGQLEMQPHSLTRILTPSPHPFAQTIPLTIVNTGDWGQTYEMEVVDADTAVKVILIGKTSNIINGRARNTQSIYIEAPIHTTGTYSNAIKITSYTAGSNIPQTHTIPINLFVWEETHHTYLPIIMK